MMGKRFELIVNFKSISVNQPIDGLILSNTIPTGIVGLAKKLSNEPAPYDTTVNKVCPVDNFTEARKLSVDIAERNESRGYCRGVM